MKQIHEKGLGKDEFLSPRDAASCIYNAISVDLPSDFIYAPLFVQSIPPTGRNARFDITNTTKLLNGWKPLDTFPSGTPYGVWTFIHNNAGVDQNIQTAINDYSINNKSLIKVVDVLGRETAIEANKLLLYIYSDGIIEKKYITK